MAKKNINSAMSKTVNKHADELNELSNIARNAKANATWCKQRIQKISEIWDGTVKSLGVIATLGLVGLWLVLTRSWYYTDSCISVDRCPSYSAVFGGAVVSLIILGLGVALTWWLARKASIESLCSRG